jgi:hypothetical protein
MLQWVDGSSEAPDKLIMRTFLSVFPAATLRNDGPIIVGTKSQKVPTGINRLQCCRACSRLTSSR